MIESYPLHWPVNRPRSRFRHTSRFETVVGKARDALLREIRLLGGTAVVLSTNVPLRRDGLLVENREPVDPGVAVYFTRKGWQVCFACDKWDLVRDNIWAVCKTIEALRGIERWGTGDMVDAAFAGFAALPPPMRPWRDVLGVANGVAMDAVRSQYKKLAMQHHPDRGGSQEKMAELNAAMEQAELESKPQ